MTDQSGLLTSTTFAFLDIETTGGNATSDRITEIGIRFWRDGEEVGEWQTLLNPETRISPFIESLTGISNDMVRDAPTFAEIADELRQQLEGKVFVAHNARFDYGFIKSEYRRLDQPFSARVLCTVKLSRRLYPQYRRHNMDALMARHHLSSVQRHRAMGDVTAMLGFFLAALKEHGREVMDSTLAELLQRPSVPSHLSPGVLLDLPGSPGVYRFYGENDVLLYVGKSTNIRQRVASHFSGDHNSARGVRISESLRHIEFTETAGELGALLLELKQIKTMRPLFNRRSRAAKRLVTIELVANGDGYLQARLAREVQLERLGDYYGLFRSKREAERALQGIAAKNELCNKLLGLEPPGAGACFQHALGNCRGACQGGEDVTKYNLRTQIAFHGLRLQTWPWQGAIGIVEENRNGGAVDILVIFNWIHVITIHDPAELSELDLANRSATFDLDSYKLLVKALMGADRDRYRIIELPEAGFPNVRMPALDYDKENGGD
ncbi:exonuclease domain-containing protein [Marinobacter zhejiangensis]|uniref:DNA-directed DNA polymerase n=1 Tax=Marinobacter zhejiangensis TaxID=488535 RepID=A0A1I4KSW6_9GAMM|nr:exonuclease domain-containing protein [Marinobacter zhejiangensis]SFL81830.1 DNA polymerase-3 subunit epsilon [Marinobacter zhejiangensis]